MTRGVGYLVLVVDGCRIGHIERLLPHVRRAELGGKTVQRLYARGHSGVQSVYPHAAEVGHLPHVKRRKSHYLVLHVVVIDVGCECDIGQPTHPPARPCESDIVLVGLLGPQSCGAALAIVQVVERGQAERMLIHRPEIEGFILQQTKREGCRRRQLPAVGGAVAVLHMLGSPCRYDVCAYLNTARGIARGKGSERRQTARVGRILGVRAQGVYESVLSQRQRQALKREPSQRGGAVIFALTIGLDITPGGIFHVGVRVAVPRIHVFRTRLQLQPAAEILSIDRLSEEFLVPHAFVRLLCIIEYDGSGQSARRAEPLRLHVQMAVAGQQSIYVGLALP